METLPPLTIADKVFADLVRAIVEGQIPAGSKISEPELAKSHGISRGPLREAIARLEACGLVIRKPNVGARVVMLSAQDMVEISEVREPLEGMACRLAAEKSTPEDIRELRALLEQHQAQDALQKGQGYFQKAGDLDFHYRIVQCCKNQKLIGLLCDDLYHLVRMYRYQYGMPSPRAQRAFGEHTLIIDAIEEGDGELAEMLMRHHIRASRKNIQARLLQAADQAQAINP